MKSEGRSQALYGLKSLHEEFGLNSGFGEKPQLPEVGVA